ncbi:MAG: SAM-dependent methyltransferase [Devosia sp.]
MKATKQAMSTARGVALLRTIEMGRPAAQRLTSDPYSRSFVNPITAFSTGLMVRSGLLDIVLPRGTIDFAIVRERYVEDLTIRETRQGIDQLVILGAGFDTRAYRIPEIGDMPVYEVDHPATQQAKRDALRRIGATLPPDHKFVAVDFDRDRLGDRLAAAGYSDLTQTGIDATLGFIAGRSAPGSMVVFDYFHRDALSGSRAAVMQVMTRAMGERITFAIDPGQIVPFLESRGFSDIDNAGAPELRKLYLTGPNAKRPLLAGAAIVSARVARN